MVEVLGKFILKDTIYAFTENTFIQFLFPLIVKECTRVDLDGWLVDWLGFMAYQPL